MHQLLNTIACVSSQHSCHERSGYTRYYRLEQPSSRLLYAVEFCWLAAQCFHSTVKQQVRPSFFDDSVSNDTHMHSPFQVLLIHQYSCHTPRCSLVHFYLCLPVVALSHTFSKARTLHFQWRAYQLTAISLCDTHYQSLSHPLQHVPSTRTRRQRWRRPL